MRFPHTEGAQVLPRHKVLLDLLASWLLGFLSCVHHSKDYTTQQLPLIFVPNSNFFLVAEDLLMTAS